eukprot:CAMPEP_0119120592 /NCGR_PEP_ID=MMETSP1310-20130426/1566_1 /TAXON_ID=464262 /ORGANISM="Genus nov. species nov., Strain RCC2339" /LENGTH=494 /DNA_ID=CAMNT_0007110079 /DNA_START=168 /DNA_END=1652 /DNA_ORIENTATION=-
MSRLMVGRAGVGRVLARGYATGEDLDLVVAGAGPAGYVAAIKAAQLGMKVACVEKRGSLGGTCLNVGCIPSKALLHASHLYHQAEHGMTKYGIDLGGKPTLNVAQMMKQKDKSVKGLTSGIEFLFKKNKVQYLKGAARVTGPNSVEVAPTNGGEPQTYATKNILVATGSDVMKLPGMDIDEERIVSSTGALSLPEVPKTMIVVGGGVIGLELGSVWSRLGAKVTVVEFMDAIAAGADDEVAANFKKILEKQGIEFKMGAKVISATRNDSDGVDVVIEGRDGGEQERVQTDVVLVSVGRVPYTKDLGLAEVGVELDDRGRVKIDEHFKTNIPSIRAVGDVVAGPMLAHKGEEEGIAAVENMVNPAAGHINYNAIPSVIYTHPEVAWVGKTEQQLKAEGVKYKIGKFPFQANSRARTVDDFYPEEFCKVLTDAETDIILGAHIINGTAGELIAEFCVALEYQASAEDIGRTCHPHPCLSEALKESCMSAYDKPIHS